MKRSRSLVLVTLFALCIAAVTVYVRPIQASAAIVTGSLTILTFPGASLTNCGTPTAVGGTVSVTGSNLLDTATLYDGTGAVVGLSVFFDSTSTFTKSFMKFNIKTPTKNPLHMVEVINGVTVVDVTGNDPCFNGIGASVPGPGVPNGFVLRTITCDTAVFTAAGDVPVPTGEKISKGQTWFVNPVSVVVRLKHWTEVFAGGYSNGFIPTSCVGGKPAGYSGM